MQLTRSAARVMMNASRLIVCRLPIIWELLPTDTPRKNSNSTIVIESTLLIIDKSFPCNI